MIGIAIALMSLMPPAEALKCGDVIEGCLQYQIPYGFVCAEAPTYGCVNGPCTYTVTCEPSGPRKPKPAPEPMLAAKEGE